MGTLHLRSVPPILLRLSLCGALFLGCTVVAVADSADESVGAAGASQPSSSDASERIIVTGSRLDTKAGQLTQEVQVYSKETIDRSGQTTLTDFLNTLPVVSVVVDPGGFQASRDAGSVRLHGMPLGTTLVLIDGRRVAISTASAPSNVFDLNNIPLAAVDRIEVLPQGSSAIYGSDAIAGVVNVVLKHDFDGLATAAKYGGASHTHETDASLAWGHRWERSSFSAIATYQGQSELQGKDRPLTANANYTAYGSRDSRFPIGNPGNVFSVNGSNLPGLNARYAAVPSGFTGPPSIAEFAATVGRLNEFSLVSDAGLIPQTDREGVLATGTYQLRPNIELFVRFLFSHLERNQHLYPDGLLLASTSFQSYTVSAANPYNPFGTKVGIGYFFPGVQLETFNTDYFMPSLGAKGQLGDRWSWEVAGWGSLDREKVTGTGQVKSAALQAALNSPNPATALDPFVAGPPGSQQLIDSVLYTQDLRYIGNAWSTAALLLGSPLALPAGDLKVAIGSEYDHSSLYDASSTNALSLQSPRVARDAAAIYGEGRIPIIGALKGGDEHLLDVTGAERYDHFSDFGGKWTAQIGAVSHPLTGLSASANWSQAFKAPSLYQLNQSQQTYTNPVVDPVTGKTEGVTVLTGGNPRLKPETGESHSFALTYADGFVPGLQASISNWIIHESNSIQSVNAQTIVNNAALFPGSVVRAPTCIGAPPCPIVSVNQTYTNFGAIDVSGIDYQLSQRFKAAGIAWNPEATVTETYKYLVAFQPGQAASNRVSAANDDLNWAPRWKARFAVEGSKDGWSGLLAARYIGNYRDYDALLSKTYLTLGDLWYFDTNLGYSLRTPGTGAWPKTVAVQLGAVNLFNRQPQFSNFRSGTYGFDIVQADMRGRFVYVQADARW